MQNMQVKQARTESNKKPIVPSSQTTLPENLTVRTQSKTKVSTGSRRNNIIGYVPRLPRKEIVAPPLTNPLPATSNNGAGGGGILPIIDGDIPCFSGGLPILDLQNEQKSKLTSNGGGIKNGKHSSQSNYNNKNGLPTFAPTSAVSTFGAGNTTSSISSSKQKNDKYSFNNTSSSSMLSSKKTNQFTNGESKTKDKNKSTYPSNDKISSISTFKKEKTLTQPSKSLNNGGLPNLIDDEFGFGQQLSESSSDEEAEDEKSNQKSISYNEFGLPILTSNNNGHNSGGAFNKPETNNKKNSFNSGSSSSKLMMNNDSSNNRNNFITQSKSSSYNSKNFSNFKNNYNSNNNNNNNYNNNNNNDSSMKHKPVITKESNSRKEVNFNKKTIAAQKRHLPESPSQDLESSAKMKKKENLNNKNNIAGNNTNTNEFKKDKKDKKEKKDKKSKNLEKDEKKKKKDSNHESIREQHSSKLNSFETNVQKLESSLKNNSSSTYNTQQLNGKLSPRTNFSNSIRSNYNNEPINNSNNQTSYNNFNKNPNNYEANNHVYRNLTNETIIIDDDDSFDSMPKVAATAPNNTVSSTLTSNISDFGGFGGLPDLSCALNDETTNHSAQSSISVHEKKSNDKKQKGVTRDRYGSKKHFEMFSSSSSPTPATLIPTPTIYNNMNSTMNSSQPNIQEFNKQNKDIYQQKQSNSKQYNNNYNQEYYQSQSLQPSPQSQHLKQQYEQPQNYENDFINVFNENQSNYENGNLNQQNPKINEKIQNHFSLESNNEYFNDKTNLNKNTNEYIGLGAIKSDDHLNSRGTSESEIGILSSSDSSSSDSDSSSSDSDSDDESQAKRSNKIKPYQNNPMNLQPPQQQQPQLQQKQLPEKQYQSNQNGIDIQSTSLSSYNNNNHNNYQYQQNNRNGYNNNQVEFLKNDLRLSESDSSDSEL